MFLDFEQPIAELEAKIEELRFVQDDSAVDISEEIERLQKKSQRAHQGDLRASSRPGRSRRSRAIRSGPTRSTTSARMFTDFEELHGDRAFADDPSIVGGLARFNGQPVHGDRPPEGPRHQGKDPAQLRHAAPGGLPQGAAPDEARGEVRLPVFTFVDTPGAYPGIGAEERGQSEAIGRNLYVMAELRGADHRHRDRRGRLGRRARDRRRRHRC